jgi:hypothetical protein
VAEVPDPEAVPIMSVERLRLRGGGDVTVATLGVSYLRAMRLPWSRAVLVYPGGERRPVVAALGFAAPLDAPAAVSLSLDPAEVVPPGSWLSFAEV